MEHNASTRHTYYAAKDDARRIVAWLIKCDYWFEGSIGTGGDFAITCAIEPDHVLRGTGIKVDTDAADAA